jgi:heme-degrading monooxygenase HmoA
MSHEQPVMVVFRSRLNDGVQEAFQQEAARMETLATAMPGFLGYKVFTADDGERVSIIEFESLESERAWRDHPEHRDAQQRGRAEYYAGYRLQVCAVQQERSFGELSG